MAEDDIFITFMRHVVGAPVPLNGQGIWFEFNDTGYYETIYAPGKHHWLMRAIMPVSVRGEG
jgi:hypothetical protein